MSFKWCASKSAFEYRPEIPPIDEFLEKDLTDEKIIGMLKSKNSYVRKHAEGVIYYTKDKKQRLKWGVLMYKTYHPRMPINWCEISSDLTFDEWYGKEDDIKFKYTNDDDIIKKEMEERRGKGGGGKAKARE